MLGPRRILVALAAVLALPAAAWAAAVDDTGTRAGDTAWPAVALAAHRHSPRAVLFWPHPTRRIAGAQAVEGFTPTATVHLSRTVRHRARRSTSRARLWPGPKVSSGYPTCAAELRLRGTDVLVRAEIPRACAVALRVASHLHALRYARR